MHLRRARTIVSTADRPDGLSAGRPRPTGDHRDCPGRKTILIDSLVDALAIVIPTIAATFAFAWWFRATNTRAHYLPDFAYSGRHGRLIV